MLCITNNSTDPHFNLALEEYAVKYLDPKEDYVILWQNSPSVIIGRNQNTTEEINAAYIKAKGINVVRRLSGGGAVYHDLGNLNFTFIMQNEEGYGPNFRRFTLPVIKALDKLGVKAELSGRNDLVIDGRKFSGNAQYYHQKRVLHHGTLLFNSDLDVVQEALNVKADKIASKGVKSVRSRVTNIIDYLDRQDVTIQEFKQLLLKYLLEEEPNSREYTLTPDDLTKIKSMMQERYLTWEWNYGQSPPFNFRKSQRFAGGNVEVLLDVKKGVIENCKIFGDFFGNEDITDFEKFFKGVRYEEEAIRNVLATVPIYKYFANIAPAEIMECFFS